MKMLELIWPGGEHAFRLGLGELEALQEKCDAGPEMVLHRIRHGAWLVCDLYEPIRLGLIGGGMDRDKANKLVKNLFESRPIETFKKPALLILFDALYGPQDDEVGKDGGPENGQVTDPPKPEMADGSSVSSTE